MTKEKLISALRELQNLGKRGVRGDDLADKPKKRVEPASYSASFARKLKERR